MLTLFKLAKTIQLHDRANKNGPRANTIMLPAQHETALAYDCIRVTGGAETQPGGGLQGGVYEGVVRIM